MQIIDPEFYKATSAEEIIIRFRDLVSQYRSLSSTHITWYTHKNPYGCWICDLLLHCETLCNYLESFLQGLEIDKFNTTKSSRPDDMSRNSQDRNQDG